MGVSFPGSASRKTVASEILTNEQAGQRVSHWSDAAFSEDGAIRESETGKYRVVLPEPSLRASADASKAARCFAMVSRASSTPSALSSAVASDAVRPAGF